MEKSDGFNAIMDSLEVGHVTWKAGNVMKPNWAVRNLGDRLYQLKCEDKFKPTEFTFRIGEKSQETTSNVFNFESEFQEGSFN
ncbi:hypothetical protein ACTXT7_014712 [Hymenolepis weldensis]